MLEKDVSFARLILLSYLMVHMQGFEIELHIAASDCILPVIFTSDYTSDFMIIDRSHLYIFHPSYLLASVCRATMKECHRCRPLTMNLKQSTVYLMEKRLTSSCKNECTAIEHHLNRYTPPDVLWSFCWNTEVDEISPSYKLHAEHRPGNDRRFTEDGACSVCFKSIQLNVQCYYCVKGDE